MKKILDTIFYGSVFYGFCTVALSIESNLQHGISLNSIRFYVLVFFATVVYYSRIYYHSSAIINVDERTNWYKTYRPAIQFFLIFSTIVILADILLIAFINLKFLVNLSPYYWGLFAVVPLLGLMYSFKILPVQKLRRVGWLKPFIIGFVWAGVVTIFPVLFWQVRHPEVTPPTLAVKTLLWLQNFLFISALAIVFDIKDYSADRKHRLNTYPATFGIYNTIYFIVYPITLACMGLLIFFHSYSNRPVAHTIIQSIPYIILLLLGKSLLKERQLLFYLAVIDGLMLLKAIAGITSILFF